MQAKDVMSSPVISIGPEFHVREIAALLLQHRIGGVPVIEGDQLIGMVTESDLLHRHEIGTDDEADPRPWWRRILDSDALPSQYVRSHGKCAQYVMTPHVVTVAPETSLSDIAGIFDTQEIGRVPVVEDGRVVGIVTATDLLKLITADGSGSVSGGTRSDASIREHLQAELTRQSWWRGAMTEVIVSNGVVEFTGVVETEALKLAAKVAAENIPGVIAVRDRRIVISELPATMM